jgi:hypothetical protein
VSVQPEPAQPEPAQQPEPALQPEPAGAEGTSAADPPAAADQDDPQTEPGAPGPTRRERREAARGGPSAKVAGPIGGRPQPPPARHRDYASRKRG